MNGIDAIYDPSDVRRMLAELRQQRLQMEEDKARRTKGATQFGTSAWKIWSGEQSTKEKELLATKDYMVDPEHTKRNWLSRAFTPADKRVIPISDREISLDKYKSLTDQDVVTGPKDTGFFARTAEKGSGLGGGAGAGLSLLETVRDWEKHDPDKRDIKRGLDIGKTGLYAASMVPGPHSPFALAGAGVLSLADLLWG